MPQIRLAAALLIGAMVLSACASPSVTPVDPPSADRVDQTVATDDANAVAAETTEMHDNAEDTMDAEVATNSENENEPMSDSPSDMTDSDQAKMAGEDAAKMDRVDLPAWQQIQLTDARTGAKFALADFAGKTIFVEPFATWCTNCRQQLGNVALARAQVDADVVFITLSVEPNIGEEALASYADAAGFDRAFAAMTPEMLQMLAGEFGQTIANPPATPHFVIRPDGSTTELATGIQSPDAIVALIQGAQGG